METDLWRIVLVILSSSQELTGHPFTTGSSSIQLHNGQWVWGEVTTARTSSSSLGTCGLVVVEGSDRIANGDASPPGAWPWMVRLLYKVNMNSSNTNCGGVLVSRRHVVTAGHCVVEEELGKPLTVVLGESDITTEYDCVDIKLGCATSGIECFRSNTCAPSAVKVPVTAVYLHPNYMNTPAGFSVYDIAVLELEDYVSWSPFIQPLCLPRPSKPSKLSDNLRVTGWGNTKAGLRGLAESSDLLQELAVREVPLDRCKALIAIPLKENTMCVNSGKAGKAACHGDSGGPLSRLWNKHLGGSGAWELAGVISFGLGRCGNDAPLVLSKLEGDLGKWVKDMVGQDLPKYP